MKGRSSRGIEGTAAILLDVLLFVAAVALALVIRFGEAIPARDLFEVRRLFPFLLLTRLGTFAGAGIYRRSFLRPRGSDFADLVEAWAAGSVILAAGVFFGRFLETSRLVLIYEAAFSLAFTLFWRGVVFLLGRTLLPPIPAAVLGTDELASRVGTFLLKEGWRYRVDRRIDDIESWDGSTALFLTSSDYDPDRLMERRRNGAVYVIADVPEITLVSAVPYDLGGMVVLSVGEVRGEHHYVWAKRTLDIVLSAAILILSGPLWVLIALAVKLDSPGPIFFRQERTGKGGKPFRILKFRTMRADLRGPDLTEDSDPRITRVGRILRRWSLDELPQVLNVLAGVMSLVGPRPELPRITRTYPAWRRLVLQTPPGLTGLVQVCGRDDLTEEEKGRLDLFYVMNRSFEMDVAILFRTVRAVWKYRGRT
ncbi:MAG: sugar transferase [Candidatus Hydrogenedentota bacterium]|nr:MAG: sugar transferase [Candidatus Hydrogenedentota bacterium]